MQDVFLNSVKKFGQNDFLGSRDPIRKKYIFKTYEEIYDISKALGSGIIHLNLANEVSEYLNYKLKFVGILSKSREEWMILDCCNMLFGFTMVPMYETLGPKTISLILQ